MNSRPERLLVVDDNEMNRDMLARRLARKGYEVVVRRGCLRFAGAHQENRI